MHTRIAFPGGAGSYEKGARGDEGSASGAAASPRWTSIADGPDYEVCGGPSPKGQSYFGRG